MQEKFLNFIYNTLATYAIAFGWVAGAAFVPVFLNPAHDEVELAFMMILGLGFIGCNFFGIVRRHFMFEVEQGRWAEYESMLLPCIIKGSELIGASIVFLDWFLPIANTPVLIVGVLLAVTGTAADAVATFVPKLFSMFAPEETLSAMLIQIEYASSFKKDLGAQYLLRFKDEHGKHYSFVTSDPDTPNWDIYVSGVLTAKGRRLLRFVPTNKYT